MNEKELYELAISDVPKYSLLNEILAIRDNRFPNEENDYTIKVYGSISLDVLNKYVNVIDNWNKLKEWLEETINKNKKLDLPDRYEMYVLGKVLDKIQEIEEKNDKRNMETN